LAVAVEAMVGALQDERAATVVGIPFRPVTKKNTGLPMT
jgi:hypothetical protein